MSQSPDVFQAAVSIFAAHLSNPNTRIDTKDLGTALQGVFHAVNDLAATAASTPVPRLAQPGLDAPFLGAAPVAALPAPTPAPVPATMTEEARQSLAGSVAFVGGSLAPAGEHLLPRVWQGVPRETQQKFLRIMETYNIPRGPDGYPIPRRPLDKLISESRMQVADPITGDYHTMLRRHLRLAHKLEHEELLAMFNLNEAQLPCTGPAYSASKAEQARRTGLGHRTPAAVAEAAPAKSRRRRREAV